MACKQANADSATHVHERVGGLTFDERKFPLTVWVANWPAAVHCCMCLPLQVLSASGPKPKAARPDAPRPLRRARAQGRSAGGLTMGAVTNMRPDQFCAVVMGVPFLDVVTTMLDPTIPLTVIEACPRGAYSGGACMLPPWWWSEGVLMSLQ